MRDFLHSAWGPGVLWLVMMLPFWALLGWFRRQTRREARQGAVQQLVWELERQIWEETLPNWQRKVLEESRQRHRGIRQEVRPPLGVAPLPGACG
jgi:hypothetical protein